jgi:hypothetical protein
MSLAKKQAVALCTGEKKAADYLNNQAEWKWLGAGFKY